MYKSIKSRGAGIARWWCVGLIVLLDAASWVRSSENFFFFFCERGFFLGVNMGSDSIPQNSFG